MTRVKWAILYDFLETKKNDSQITLTFEELEDILGNALPESAFIYDAWWRNDHSHSQARAWMNAGWKTYKPNPYEKRITFTR